MDCTAAGGNECMNVLFQKRKKNQFVQVYTCSKDDKKKRTATTITSKD